MLLPVFLTLPPTLIWVSRIGGCYAVVEGIFKLSSWHVRRLGKADDAFDRSVEILVTDVGVMKATLSDDAFDRSVETLVTDVGVIKGTLSSMEATLSSMEATLSSMEATLSSMLNIQTGILIAIVATIMFVIVIGGLLIFAAAAFFWWNKRQAPQAQNAPHGVCGVPAAPQNAQHGGGGGAPQTQNAPHGGGGVPAAPQNAQHGGGGGAPQTQNAPHGGGGGIGGGGGADIGGWTQSQLVQAMVQAMNAPNEPFAAGAHTPLASPLPTAAAAAWGTPLQSPPAAEHAAAAAPAPAPAPAPA